MKINLFLAGLLSLAALSCRKSTPEMAPESNGVENGNPLLKIMCRPTGMHREKTLTLPKPKDRLVAEALGNRVVFTDGHDANIFNTDLGTWSTRLLSTTSGDAVGAAATKKMAFGGGYNLSLSDRVDIYDATTNTWTVSHLSEPKQNLAATSWGSKIYFAGGDHGVHSLSSVDIYDENTNAWTHANLSIPRTWLAATAADGKVFFAGGGDFGYAPIYDRIDILDAATGAWSIATLPHARSGLCAAAVGTTVIFAGGNTTPYEADIYDTRTGVFTVSHLTVNAGRDLVGFSFGTKILFGNNESGSRVLDYYDVCSKVWGTMSLSAGNVDGPGAVLRGKLYVGGGWGAHGPTKSVDVYDESLYGLVN